MKREVHTKVFLTFGASSAIVEMVAVDKARITLSPAALTLDYEDLHAIREAIEDIMEVMIENENRR